MSAVAMFSLKDESLLQFDHQRNGAQRRHNLKTLYGVAKTPSDSQMRSVVDGVDPLRLRPAFRAIHQGLQRYGVLETYRFLGKYLVILDGTGLFSSGAVCCPDCCIKQHQDVLMRSSRVLSWRLTGSLQTGIHGLGGLICQQKIKVWGATCYSDWTQIAEIADSINSLKSRWNILAETQIRLAEHFNGINAFCNGARDPILVVRRLIFVGGDAYHFSNHARGGCGLFHTDPGCL